MQINANIYAYSRMYKTVELAFSLSKLEKDYNLVKQNKKL